MEYYTITEIAAKLGIKRHKILQIVRGGEVKSRRSESQTSAYQIPKTELKKLREIVNAEVPTKKKTNSNKRAAANNGSTEILSPESSPLKNGHYEDFIQMQKVILETMHNLSSTQEKIAETLSYLAKKL